MIKKVRAKKNLGQHFLIDESIAENIVKSLQEKGNVLEIGAGMGVLTKYLLNSNIKNFFVVEIDTESVVYLNENYPQLHDKIIEDNFLKIDINSIFDENCAIIGNFPYNISNQILFKVFDNKDKVDEVVGMFQKEVAERVVAKSGNKTYGILSVLLSAFYDIDYLFTVPNTVFSPIPKVQSAVIRLRRNKTKELQCNEKDFFLVVKTAFNQRRKMLRQSLKALNKDLSKVDKNVLTLRAEQLTVEDFINLTKNIYNV